MNPKELVLKVNANLTFNVNTQIKEQLKWLIGTNKIQSGEMLPSAAHLADLLGLNRNTINWVYNQLRDEGIVSMHKGRGTIVCNNAETEQLRKERLPMLQLLTETTQAAQSEGIDLQQFFIAGLASIQWQHPESPKQLQIILVECKEHDHPFYRSEIERITGCDVYTVFIEDLTADKRSIGDVFAHADVIITTLNHSDQVETLLASAEKELFVIGATVEPSLLLHIARLNAGIHVAFVCLGKSGGEWMASRIEDAGINQIHTNTLGLVDQSPENIANTLQHADKIYASSSVFEQLKEMAPDKVELYPMRLEKSSENLLKQFTNSSLSK